MASVLAMRQRNGYRYVVSDRENGMFEIACSCSAIDSDGNDVLIPMAEMVVPDTAFGILLSVVMDAHAALETSDD